MHQLLEKKNAAVAAMMSKVDMQIIQGKQLMSAEETGLMSYIYIYKCIYLDLEMNDPRVG